MRFYLATSFIFPRSFRLRLFAICFVATHIPLISYIGWRAWSGHLALADVILLTLATVIGTAFALFGIGALLNPVQAAADALEAVERGEDVPELPNAPDMVGTLMAGVSRAASAARILDVAAKEDPLTGIRNRRGFLADLAELEPDACRGAIAIIDLDNFKQVNDRFGHEIGDRVLAGLASRLSSELRRHDLLARWGGEEFAVLFCHTSEEDAARTLERLGTSLARDPLLLIDGDPVTFSAGVAVYRGGDFDEVLRVADEALYEAKHAGRNCVRRASQGAAHPEPQS